MADGHAAADFVLLYAPPWSGPTRFSKHHLARHLAAKGSRVMYVEAPLTPLGVRRGKSFLNELRHALERPRQVHDRLWIRRYVTPVPYHAATPLTNLRLANRIGQRLLAPTIRRDFGHLGFNDPILIAGLPHAADVVAALPRRALIYHCADDYSHVRGFPSTLPELEADLCRWADLVITTSQTLCETRRGFNPNTHWVPNGADVRHFSRVGEPAADMQRDERPVIGFVGGISQWVDVGLVAELARQCRHWSFVLVGPVGVDVSALQGLPNVRLLGPRAYETLPSYLTAMDVGLIPFKQDPVTYHADPIKVYEYLAAGLPVVATDMPALRRLAHVVRLAQTTREFAAHIEQALAEGRDVRRVERQMEAARHSWENRFDTIDALIRRSI